MQNIFSMEYAMLTVLSEFKLKSKYLRLVNSLNVAGGTDAITFRLISKI